MVDEFSCNGSNMQDVLTKLQSVKESLNTAYKSALDVKKEIDSKSHWTGNSQKTMAAFMDLLTQYHKDLAEEGDAPVPKAIQHLKELQEHLGNFYDEWEEYEGLRNIV